MPEPKNKIITKTFELSIGVLKIKSNFEIVNIFGPEHKQLFTTKFYHCEKSFSIPTMKFSFEEQIGFQ